MSRTSITYEMASVIQRRMCISYKMSAWSCFQFRTYHNAESAETRRITIPHKMAEKIQRIKGKVAAKSLTRNRFKGPVVISCKNTDFNHHSGQTYSNFSPQKLASGSWKNKKSVGDYFTINNMNSNPSLFDKNPPSLESLGIDKEIIKALKNCGIESPTKIQALAIPSMIKGNHILCAAETGSGKTLAYIIPILQRLFEYRDVYGQTGATNQPYCIILAPSRELVDQLLSVCKDLAAYVDFKVASTCGGRGTQSLLRHRPQQEMDLLISTPGILSKLNTNKIIDMSRVYSVVFDEADSLFDDSFNELTIRLLRKLSSGAVAVYEDDGSVSAVGTQVALIGATLPKGLNRIMGDTMNMNTVETITTKSLHKLMPHVPQRFLRLHSNDKAEALIKILKANDRRERPTIVFCNKTSTVRYLGHVVEDIGLNHVLFHADMPQKIREGRFNQFQNGEVDLLISTDLGSRGLDTIRAQYVVNYDFPNFMSDYIHRVGRVGRVGTTGTGYVSSFVTHKWDVDLLWRIEASARQVTELHNVNANIKRKLKAVGQKNKSLFAVEDLL